MKRSYPRLATLLVLCAAAANASLAAIEYADITGGRIQGETKGGLASFKGLPFAAPPVGALRWKVPQPVVPWRGVRKADTFARACIQPWPGNPEPPTSEDCLYLNVWTAAKTANERRPVMVWIHGGGLTNGMSWQDLSYGTKLAPEGAVLVTIAYRLGALGFLAHPELNLESGSGSGNYGLFDVVAALRWVQANIAQFGGDPSRVTIFGGSSGGHIVSLLSGAPTAKGLFQRALATGRASFYPNLDLIPPNLNPLPSLPAAEKTGEDFFKSLGVPNLASARNLSAQTISDVLASSQADFGTTIDGTLIVGSNLKLFQQGKFNDEPILVGYSTDEAGATPPKVFVDWMDSVIAGSACKQAQAAIAKIYPRTNDPETSVSGGRKLHTSGGPKLHTR